MRREKPPGRQKGAWLFSMLLAVCLMIAALPLSVSAAGEYVPGNPRWSGYQNQVQWGRPAGAASGDSFEYEAQLLLGDDVVESKAVEIDTYLFFTNDVVTRPQEEYTIRVRARWIMIVGDPDGQYMVADVGEWGPWATKAGSGGGEAEPPHEHSYTQKHDAAQHWQACSCGDKKDAADHSFGAWTADGNTESRTCTVCGYAETRDAAQTSATGETTDNGQDSGGEGIAELTDENTGVSVSLSEAVPEGMELYAGVMEAESLLFAPIRPFAVGMAVYTGILWLGDLLGVTGQGSWLGTLLGLAAMAISLYVSWSVVQAIRDVESRREADLNSTSLKTAWTVLAVAQVAAYVLALLVSLLALLGVDRHFQKRKSGLLILSVLGMILTSFYFSVGGLLALTAYAVTEYLKCGTENAAYEAEQENRKVSRNQKAGAEKKQMAGEKSSGTVEALAGLRSLFWRSNPLCASGPRRNPSFRYSADPIGCRLVRRQRRGRTRHRSGRHCRTFYRSGDVETAVSDPASLLHAVWHWPLRICGGGAFGQSDRKEPVA